MLQSEGEPAEVIDSELTRFRLVVSRRAPALRRAFEQEICGIAGAQQVEFEPLDIGGEIRQSARH